MGIGDWELGIGDKGLGAIRNAHSPNTNRATPKPKPTNIKTHYL